MLWVAALLALILWTIGQASDFLGLRNYLFLLLALLCALGALLPPRQTDGAPPEPPAPAGTTTNANSVPAAPPEESAAEPVHSISHQV